jgi:hypothetical protein
MTRTYAGVSDRSKHARGRFVAPRCRLPLTSATWPGFACPLATTLNALLNLELLGDGSFDQRSAAVGAAFGQGRLVNLIGLFGSGRLAMRLGAVVLSWLASGFFGVWLGLVLSEGSSLPLASTGCLVQLAAETFVLGLLVVNPSLKGLGVGTPNRFHTGIIRRMGGVGATTASGELLSFKLGRSSNTFYKGVRVAESRRWPSFWLDARASSGILSRAEAVDFTRLQASVWERRPRSRRRRA